MTDSAETMREAIARCIIGPRFPVPVGSKLTLNELRAVKWSQASKAEKQDALNAATAILAMQTERRGVKP